MMGVYTPLQTLILIHSATQSSAHRPKSAYMLTRTIIHTHKHFVAQSLADLHMNASTQILYCEHKHKAHAKYKHHDTRPSHKYKPTNVCMHEHVPVHTHSSLHCLHSYTH